METLPARFIDKIMVFDECWYWIGSVEKNGYGRVKVDGSMKMAHRAVYELLVGEIPAGLELDHTCHDPTKCVSGWACQHRRCVNPSHLDPVTPAENSRRGGNANLGELCRNAQHPWTGGEEECRDCERERKRRHGMVWEDCSDCGRPGLRKHRARHRRTHLNR